MRLPGTERAGPRPNHGLLSAATLLDAQFAAYVKELARAAAAAEQRRPSCVPAADSIQLRLFP